MKDDLRGSINMEHFVSEGQTAGNPLDRVQPNEPDAERALIGSIIGAHDDPKLQKSLIRALLDCGVSKKTFYFELNQYFFETILQMYERDEVVDLVTIQRPLEQSGYFQSILSHDLKDMSQVVSHLDEMTYFGTDSLQNIAYYAGLIREAHLRRRLMKAAWEASNTQTPIEETVEEVDRVISDFPQAGPLLEVVSAGDLMANEVEDPPMIVGEGVLPYFGYTIIAGITKTGKTTLAMQLCISISTGTSFLGFPIENQVNMLYCYLEGTPATISKLLRQQTDGWGSPVNVEKIHLIECRELSLDTKHGLGFLESKIESINAGLVVIDPLLLAMEKDVNKLENVNAFVRRLKRLEISLGRRVSWIFIHHYGKPTIEKRESILKTLGSSGWGNWTESFLGMERYSERRSPDYKKIEFKKRHGAETPPIYVYLNPKTRLFEVVESPSDIPSIEVDSVAEILKEHGKPATYTKLRTLLEMELGISEGHAGRLVNEARKSGLIEKSKGKFGVYTVCEDGEKKILKLNL